MNRCNKIVQQQDLTGVGVEERRAFVELWEAGVGVHGSDVAVTVGLDLGTRGWMRVRG